MRKHTSIVLKPMNTSIVLKPMRSQQENKKARIEPRTNVVARVFNDEKNKSKSSNRKVTFYKSQKEDSVKSKKYIKPMPIQRNMRFSEIKFARKSCWYSKRGIRNFYLMQNQDYLFVKEHESQSMYGVFDGHGKYGAMIAETASLKIVEKYEKQGKKSLRNLSEMHTEDIITNIFQESHEHICTYFPKESEHSGTAALLIILREKQLLCFNVGSCRAVLAKRLKDGKLAGFPLSSDHNLDRFDQKNRVIQSGAVLEQHRDDNNCRLGPERIWKKGQRYPGTFITRSLGMHLSSGLGIISKPEYTRIQRRQSFQFVLAGTDGFWDVFSNSEAINFLTPYWQQQKLEEGLFKIFEAAEKRWEKETDLMDDISLIVIKLA